MDFLDPQKKKMRSIELMVGYLLVGVLILLGTVVLLYQAYGFGLDKNGHIIQNGLIFVSSNPSPSAIYVNGEQKGNTNARLILPAGQYTLQLKKPLYRTWQRGFNVEGASVEHFDYPILIPTTPITKVIATYSSQPRLSMESPDRRWLMVQQPDSPANFDNYDLNNPKNLPAVVSLPPLLIPAAINDLNSLKLVQWSNDNRHIVLKYNSGSNVHFLLLDRQTPANSIDLNSTLAISPTNIVLIDNAYDQYYIYTSTNATLLKASLQNPVPTAVIDHVLSFTSYGTNLVLYASDLNAPSGEALIRLHDGTKDYLLSNVPIGEHYLLSLSQYNGSWFYAIGSSTENKVYIYKNPEQYLQDQPDQPLVQINVLRIINPNFISFSSNSQIITVENGPQFAVYDAENDKTYSYTMNGAFDSPQLHATWIDGYHMSIVSEGKMNLMDYDGTNLQPLEDSSPNFPAYFDKNFKIIYSLAPNSQTTTRPANAAPNSTYILTSTSLVAQ